MKASSFFHRLSLFQKALFFSVILHILVFGIRIYNPGNIQAYFVQTPLEVILVNAHSEEVPQKAQAIAQHNLNGGGQVAKQLSSTPLPQQKITQNGPNLEDQALQALQALQARLLAQKKTELLAFFQTAADSSLNEIQTQRQEQKRIRLSQQIAAIERRINEQNSRPRLRYLSPATQSAPYALYYAAMRDKIEEEGTRNFPVHLGQRLYGALVMEIVVLANGYLQSATIVQGSGNSVLDAKALAIVRSAGAFERFPAAMRKNADLIAVITRFQFTRNTGLTTQLQS